MAEEERDKRARAFHEKQRTNPLIQDHPSTLAAAQTPWEELPEMVKHIARAAVGWWPELGEEKGE